MSDALRIARGFALPLDLVTEATAIVATRGAGKSSASAVIVEEGFGLGVQSVIFDRTGVYWGLRSNAKGDGAGLAIYVLGGPHGDVPLEPHAGVLIADLVVDSGHSFVLDLSDFSKGQATKFAADFLDRLYDRKARARTTLLLVMDEAHFYAPQTPRGGFKGDSARLMGAMEDVVGLGRSRGIGVVLTTQRTQSLNKAVLDLIETLLVMRMLSPRARDAVKGWISEKQEDEHGVLSTLDSLPTGTAWVWSPLRGVLEKAALRRIKTFDSYATPKPGETRVEPSARRELDLTTLGEQIAATVERAKENDPAELRKALRLANDRVKILDEMVEAFQREPEKVVEVTLPPVEVEVPVFPVVLKESLERDLDQIGAAATGVMAQIAEMLARTRGRLEQDWQLAMEMDAANGHVPLRDGHQAPRPAPQPVAPPPKPADAARSVRPPAPLAPVVLPAVNVTLPEATRLPSGTLNPSEQKVLDAFAWYEALGIMVPTKQQAALVAGYKAIGGRFGNLLGGLRSKGLVDYPAAGTATLTPEGRAHATALTLPHDNAAVQQQIMARLDPSQQRVLGVVIRYYPDAVEKQAAATECGYAAVGGRFGNLLGSLRSLGLVEYPAGGLVVARDVLFPIR